MNTKDLGPEIATPFGIMYVRTYAAIHLRQPCSGIPEIDEMIRKAKREEIALKVLAGVCADSSVGSIDEDTCNWALKVTDNFIAASGETKP